MYLLLFLSFSACMKKDLLKSARSAFTNENCVKTLETYMRSAKCSELYVKQTDTEIILRCKKKDEERGIMWDNYWFRISPSALRIIPEQMPEIEKHTICIDNSHRVEAYPPE